MSFLCKKYHLRLLKRYFFSNSPSFCKGGGKVTLGDGVEFATGLEKREILAKLAGNDNPYAVGVIKRGAGTRAQPNEIPSAFDRRLVGCVCEEESAVVSWMWLHKGEPKRCECGHWFTLVHKAPV